MWILESICRWKRLVEILLEYHRLLAFCHWARRRRRVRKRGPETSVKHASVGSVYSVIPESTSFAVVQVLAVDGPIVHVRVLTRRFGLRPPGTASYSHSWGISHLALSEAEFARWEPLLLTTAPVPATSLEAYRMWQESRGSVWR